MTPIKLLQRSHCEELTFAAEAEERDGWLQETVDVKCMDVLRWAVRAREREVTFQQLANILGARVVHRDLALRHSTSLRDPVMMGRVIDAAGRLTIRCAVVEDDAELLALDLSAFTPESGFPSLSNPERGSFFGESSRPELYLVAERGGELVGYAQFREKYPFEEGAGVLGIFGLAVAPAARRLGVGSALLDAVATEGRRRGAWKLCLNVLATNAGAQRLYERHGFVVEGRARDEFLINGARVDDLRLAKLLGPPAMQR